MTLFLARRSAERFDDLVEGGRRDDVDPALTELLELVGALRTTPAAQPRPEFVADLRERLLLAAETELTPVKASRDRDDVARLTIKPSRSRRERRIGVAIGTVAIIGATTSMAVASQSALPGDALYPVKRAIENTEAGFSRGDDAKGETILNNASVRLDEVDQLSEEQKPDVKLVTQTLNTFSSQATDASNHLLSDYEQNGDDHSIQQLHGFTQQSMNQLTDLAAVIPPAAHDALADAAQVLFTIDASATDVCPDCGTGLTELPAQLVADAAGTLAGVTHVLGDGSTTPSAAPSARPQSGHQDGSQDGGKADGSVSGLNPPETPIQVPDQPSASTDTGLGGLLGGATAGNHSGTGSGTGSGTSSSGSSGSNNAGTSGNHGGKGGKGDHHAAVDLTPVTTAVDQVVTGLVQGVNGLLNGLTGGSTTGPSAP